MPAPFAPWIRERLWRASNWPGELQALRALIAAEPRGPRSIERTYELARVVDECDPDRGRALALYIDASRGGHRDARARGKELAIELRADMSLAELALADGDLATAGAAYLDAGFPELAVEPLRKLVVQRPVGASVPTEALRLELANVLLAFADRRPVDANKELDQALTRAAHASGAAAAVAYVHAVRVARLGKLPERIPAVLAAAQHACPDDDAIAALVETQLFDANNTDGLLDQYRRRFERAPSRAAYVARVRAAGTELIARNQQPAAGLRLLRMALEEAYATLLPDVRSHVAAWELLVTHARAHQTSRELVPMLVNAMASPVSEDVAVYLAQLGLEIAWSEVGDVVAAQPYAATLLDFVPDHPRAIALAKELGLEVPAAPVASPPPAAVTPTPTPTPAKRPSQPIAPITQPLPVTPAPAPAITQSGRIRIATVEQGPVKRVAAPAAADKPARVSGRLALLQPPPPRTTTFRRDVSPVPSPPPPPPAAPAAPAPAPPQARAPRTIMPVDATVELPNGEFFTTMLRDVSTSGAFVVTKRKLEIGVVVALELEIPSANSVRVSSHRASARIARRTDVGCGLAFVDPSPELVAAIDAVAK